jgi:ribonuclease J
LDAEEAAWLMDKARELARRSLDGEDHRVEWPAINAKVKDTVAKFLYDETRRRPMVLPVAVEV